jgi:hypothetical protein
MILAKRSIGKAGPSEMEGLASVRAALRPINFCQDEMALLSSEAKLPTNPLGNK